MFTSLLYCQLHCKITVSNDISVISISDMINYVPCTVSVFDFCFLFRKKRMVLSFNVNKILKFKVILHFFFFFFIFLTKELSLNSDFELWFGNEAFWGLWFPRRTPSVSELSRNRIFSCHFEFSELKIIWKWYLKWMRMIWH